MISFNNINWKVAIATAQTMAVANDLSRHVGSFGGWALDANKQPVVFQVQVTVKDIGGEHTRTETDYYFIPTTQPDQAIAIAKAIATYNFLDKELPSVEVQQEMKVEQPKAQDNVSEERRPEVQVSKSKEEPANPEQSEKKRRGRKPKAEIVTNAAELIEAETTPAEVTEAYDNTKASHKDALIAMLDRDFAGWRDLGKERTKAMSQALVGQPFLDQFGVVAKSFRELITKHING